MLVMQQNVSQKEAQYQKDCYCQGSTSIFTTTTPLSFAGFRIVTRTTWAWIFEGRVVFKDVLLPSV
jgi:hypothetical protein